MCFWLNSLFLLGITFDPSMFNGMFLCQKSVSTLYGYCSSFMWSKGEKLTQILNTYTCITAQRLSFISNCFLCVCFFRNTRRRHREGSPLKNKWFFITFRKSFGNPEPLPFFPHPRPTHDQSSFWNVTNSILLEKKVINFLDKTAGDHYEKCCRRRNKQYVYTSLSIDVRRKNCTASSWSLWHSLTWYLSRLLVKIL